ncbi:DNA cytosine methyltransferase [Rhodoferax ferrireducens]|uniref:DNA cytosine methyltransferase n=1 Tax=Rhodoferax ferrireducens TaxID=192843 RepID=UPI003BB7D3D1
MQAIDLFSGAGGMSTGASMCGIDVRFAVEMDKFAADTFKLNHKSAKLFDCDIRKVNGSDFASVDRKDPVIVFGGPPCQGFSTSNQKNRDIENENNWLYREYLRLVSEVKPDWVVFENVKGLLETENGYFLDAVLKGFKKAGYTTNHFVLNSADYGVPQKRNRLFIIGSLHGVKITAPERTQRKHVTVSQAFKDLPDLENGDAPDEKEYATPARTNYAKALRGALKLCNSNLVTNNAPHIVERYSHIPQGGNWENIPKHLMGNYTDVTRCHTGIYRRLKEDEPSVVIGNFRKNMLIHPWKDRGLSVREAARLQSFPDSFKFAGSIGFQQQQVGNAVPPILAKAVFSKILAHG